MPTILSIDQGTSGTKTLIVDEKGQVLAKASVPLKTNYLHEGFVEQDPAAIVENVLSSVQQCIAAFVQQGYAVADIAACGISNQRETFLVWDKQGAPLYNAVVWQCKRSINICERLKQLNLEAPVKEKTGLLIDPYFSATKLIWLYENVEAVHKVIDAGEAYFGTVDTWLLYTLTGGKQYATDYTNASRTLFFNLHTLDWDKELLAAFGLSALNLPACCPSSYSFGETDFNGLLPTAIPVTAMIGDSHAAAFGEGCFTAGTAKATMGTGCSILMNIGDQLRPSANGMVTTICWSTEQQVQYALEGVIVTCGATIEWLKNELGIIANSAQTAAMAASVEDNNGVYLIPAFSGLGAPYWNMSCKASITGLTFSANKNHIVRAALESIPYQIKDVIEAMEADTGLSLHQLMIDGGISANAFIVQFLSNLLNKPVVNIGMPDVSALGAAYLAGLKKGIYKSLEHLQQLSIEQRTTSPNGDTKVQAYYAEWTNRIKDLSGKLFAQQVV